MIDLSADISNRIAILLDDLEDSIPTEMGSLITLLKSQISQLKCDEGLLADIIILLNEYYHPLLIDSPKVDSFLFKQEKENNEKIGELIIALHQLQSQEIQVQSIKVRR